MTNMLNIASLSHITRSEGDPKVIHAGPSSRGVPDSLAKGLGWFSLGLGLTELLAPPAHHLRPRHGGQGGVGACLRRPGDWQRHPLPVGR